MIFSMAFSAHLGMSMAISMKIEMAVRTARTRIRRPARAMRVAFHPGSLSASLSMGGCRSLFVSLRIDSGNLSYVHGKFDRRMICRWFSELPIDVTKDLAMLMCSPVAMPNLSSNAFRISNSEREGVANNATSSAHVSRCKGS